MSDSIQPRTVLPSSGNRPAEAERASAGAWTLLGIAGWGFVLIGLMDVGFV